jgi:hypothetical protein
MQPASAIPEYDTRDDIAAGLALVKSLFNPTTIVVIHPDRGGAIGKYLDDVSYGKVSKWAAEHNRAGCNVYFTPNQPYAGLDKKPSAAEICLIRGVFADIDVTDERPMGTARDVVMKLPAASIVIASGGGFQPIWLLAEPLQVTPEAIDRVQSLGKKIAGIAGGDAIYNISWVLRLPFSVNYPNKVKRKRGREVCNAGIFNMEQQR